MTPLFISYFDSWPNARFRGDKHRPPYTLKVKNLVRNGLHVDHYDNVDHYNTFKSQNLGKTRRSLRHVDHYANFFENVYLH